MLDKKQKKLKLTDTEVATKLDISTEKWASIKSGDTPSLKDLKAICELFNLKMWEVVENGKRRLER